MDGGRACPGDAGSQVEDAFSSGPSGCASAAYYSAPEIWNANDNRGSIATKRHKESLCAFSWLSSLPSNLPLLVGLTMAVKQLYVTTVFAALVGYIEASATVH